MKLSATDHDVEAAIRKIVSAGYSLPKDTTTDSLTRVWRKVLEGIEPEELRRGVDAWLKEGDRYFPRPGTIRKHAIGERGGEVSSWDLAGRYLNWEQHHEGPCPICGGGFEVVNGRYHIVHKPDPHDAKGIPWVGLPHRELPELEH